ncbi:MAG: chloride channel protein [Bacteroidales bacterium]|jgi:chloride channel protein, CIC family|nr:chloride channel protein [Bacteroidales bacterium]MDD3161052.1 chloride channel protein [Bacteroidales bacterium]
MKDWGFQFLLWREKHITEKQFLLILSFIIGIFTSLAANLLKSLIHAVQQFLTQNFHTEEANYLYLVYPVLGILITGLLVRYWVRDDISHGITRILYALSRREGRIKRHNIWTSIFTSSITIGFGGSVGAEAPIVLTGSAIGSNLGSFFKMDQKTLMLLIGCGASGAIAGIFKAPIAGLVFTLEVLMLDLTLTSVMPLLISSVTALSVSYIFTGNEAMFAFTQTSPFVMERIPWVILLGIVCGLVSLYMIRTMSWTEGKFRKLQTPTKKFMVGAIILSISIFLFPPLYGEGYDSISYLLKGDAMHLLQGSFFYNTDLNHFLTGSPLEGIINLNYWIIVAYILLVIITKVFASTATNGGGGVGGVFAPSLFLGCLAGYEVAHSINYFYGTNMLPEENFALMGMAGVMAGVMHAPLTGIFLIAELTGGYGLLLPLMIVAIVSFLTILVFEPHSIYAIRLAQKGELITHHKDKAVLTLMKMENVIEKDLESVHPEMKLEELVKVISRSKRNIFPVTNEKNIFLGIVLLDDIRNIMFQQDLYQQLDVRKLMTIPPTKLHTTDPMETVMKKFDDTNAWNLPVVDETGVYVGFVSKSKIFNSYRKVLVHFFDE